MVRKLLFTLGFGLLSVGSESHSPVAAQEAAQVERATSAKARGALLWDYDQAAWHGTDRFQVDFKDGYPQGTRGYIVEPADSGGYDSIFYAERDGRLVAVARYRWSSGSTVTGGPVTSDNSALSTKLEQMIRARQIALDSASDIKDLVYCSKSLPNTIVLPPEADGTVSVYLLSPTNDATVYPLGGHSRIDVSAAGKVVASRPFMKSCFPVTWKEENGQKPEAFFATHVLDAQPNEIDFFVSRNIPIVMMIGAGGWIWPIAGGELYEARQMKR
jgi:hypothetical protein